MATNYKPVKLTWKEDEEWMCNFVYEHASPSAYLKDLIKEDYKKKYKEEVDKIKKESNLPDFLDQFK